MIKRQAAWVWMDLGPATNQIQGWSLFGKVDLGLDELVFR